MVFWGWALKLLGSRRSWLWLGGILTIGVALYAVHSAVESWEEAIAATVTARAEIMDLQGQNATLLSELAKVKNERVIVEKLWLERYAALEESAEALEGRETVIYRYREDENETQCLDTAVPEPITDSLLDYARTRNANR